MRRAIPTMLALLLLLSACGGDGVSPGDLGKVISPVPDADPVDLVEVSVIRRGGLCATADGGVGCETVTTVSSDGTVTVTVPAADPEVTAAPTTAAAELAAIVTSGRDALMATKFTGTCPTAFDGAELGLRVRVIPTGAGAEAADASVIEVWGCQFDLESGRAAGVLADFASVWSGHGLPNGP